MNQPNPADHQTPARMVAGALAHLARHMETGCPRSAWLAAMLLEQVANDPEADCHLRAHARELVGILEKDLEKETAVGAFSGRESTGRKNIEPTRRGTWTRTRY